ncbi:MAG: 1-deoxy-D-xylulose-5-phosphate reductoisomerase [Acidobacteriota bacterium]
MDKHSKGIVILGSTGSIGTSALDLVEQLNTMGGRTAEGSARFRVLGLSAHRNLDRFAEQVRRFRPRIACIGTQDLATRLQERLGTNSTRIVWGLQGLLEVATLEDAEFVLAGIVGAAGLEPTYAAVAAGKVVGLANKEALVLAGDLMISTARRSGASLLPVDSEHCAIHQCLRGERTHEIRRLILTASGGPFFARPEADFRTITPAEALAHPTWVMGRKISIDSATLMNKALEVIEAHWLYGVPADRISVVIHPQSTIHSMVEFVDGSVICQLGAADMRHPIQYALTYPDRTATPLAPVRMSDMEALTFAEPDRARFPCLDFGWRALKAGGTMPVVLNASNEVAVAAFLDDGVRFDEIPRIIDTVMQAHKPGRASSIEGILEADAWARLQASRTIEECRQAGTSRSGGAN